MGRGRAVSRFMSICTFSSGFCYSFWLFQDGRKAAIRVPREEENFYPPYLDQSFRDCALSSTASLSFASREHAESP